VCGARAGICQVTAIEAHSLTINACIVQALFFAGDVAIPVAAAR